MSALKIVLVVFALTYANAQTRFEPCGDGSPVPTSFRFSDCLDKCIVVAGDVVDFQINFIAPIAASEIDVYFDVVTSQNIKSITRFSLPEPGCSKVVNGACPIAPGDNVSVTSEVGVVDFGKEVVLLAEFRLESGNGTLACAAIPVRDVKKPLALNSTGAP